MLGNLSQCANTKVQLLLFVDPHTTSSIMLKHTLSKVKGPRGISKFTNYQTEIQEFAEEVIK